MTFSLSDDLGSYRLPPDTADLHIHGSDKPVTLEQREGIFPREDITRAVRTEIDVALAQAGLTRENGMLMVCCECKGKLRARPKDTDDTHSRFIEISRAVGEAISKVMDPPVSHGFCPECADKLTQEADEEWETSGAFVK